MKKSLIATAVAAGVLATGAAQAQPTVYGIIHLSIDTFSENHYGNTDATSIAKPDEPEMNSNTSAIGVKGSEDLGGGLKAIYKLEWQVDVANRATNGLVDRDQWVGLKGGWGKVAAGTMSSNYKQMGGKIDPLYRTVAEGRGILNMQSGLHGGAGNDGQGRMTQALQYTTPKMAGIEIVVNTTVAAAGGGDCQTPTTPTTGPGCDETIGIGARWSNKNFLVFLDYLDPNNGGTGPADATTAPTSFLDESVFKIGGKWSNDAFQVSGQYEATEDQLGGNYIFLNGLWNINKSNLVTLSFGQQDKVSQSYAAAYVYKFSKQTNVYAAYGYVEADRCEQNVLAAGDKICSYDGVGFTKDSTSTVIRSHEDGSVLALGIRKSF